MLGRRITDSNRVDRINPNSDPMDRLTPGSKSVDRMNSVSDRRE